MRSARWWPVWALAVVVGLGGCGGSGSSGGGGMAGDGGAAGEGPSECEPVPVEVDETCTSFCARVVGECEAFTFDEAACRRGCQANLSEAYGCSDSCGVALEAMFQCLADTEDCRDVYDWRDLVTGHACTTAVGNVGAVCPL